MVVVANEKQEGGRRKEKATNIKSNNPHLAGGEIFNNLGLQNWIRSVLN